MGSCSYLWENLCLRGMTNEICATCKEKLEVKDRRFAERWIDPLVVLGRNRAPATECLRNLLANRPAFLVCGGPSANGLPLERLNKRGVWSMCVNNMGGHHRFRPQAFVCSDPPKKFSHSIWLDPGIMKFVPIPKLSGRRSRLRVKRDGVFLAEDKKLATGVCPNTWGFQRNPWLWADDRFFLGEGACWGNHDAGVRKTGEQKTVCTMLLGIRLLRFLGANRIYLVGVDFRMGDGYGYSFAQARDTGACQSNNAQFVVVNDWMCRMQRNGVFDRFGLKIYNCFERSGLRAFPFVPFERAIMDCKGLVEDAPDLSGWYEK